MLHMTWNLCLNWGGGEDGEGLENQARRVWQIKPEDIGDTSVEMYWRSKHHVSYACESSD